MQNDIASLLLMESCQFIPIEQGQIIHIIKQYL